MCVSTLKRVTATGFLVLAALIAAHEVASAQEQVLQPTSVVRSVKHDTSPPLRELMMLAPPALPPSGEPREIPMLEIPHERDAAPPSTVIDPVAQTHYGSVGMPLPIVNFEGINNLCGCYPPDPNGAPGPNHYLQTVNTHFAIYDRSGTLLSGPSLLAVLWSGFPGPWSGRNDGDPITLYDRYANRWLVSQFSVPAGGPYHILFAISTTSDPLGTWHRYAFQFTEFPDYPKIGVWPDGYYLTAALFAGGTTFVGNGAAVVERDSMLVGNNARMVNFTLSSPPTRILPSDVDGPLPPPGTPNYIAGVIDGELSGGVDRFEIYELHVDWTNPPGSTFTGPLQLPTSPFEFNVCASRNCIPQPGTAVGLDALSNRLMFRLQYRNFGGYQTLVANHTVKVGGILHAGIRWYELRRGGGPWAIHQEGTYVPDAHHRWMASIAMDLFGNIGLGFSISSSSIFPSIRFTGRRPYDPLAR